MRRCLDETIAELETYLATRKRSIGTGSPWDSFFHGMALNTTVWSYAGKCILADSHFLPDGWVLIDYFKGAFDDYRELLDAKTAAA
jgi:hypothetical protein